MWASFEHSCIINKRRGDWGAAVDALLCSGVSPETSSMADMWVYVSMFLGTAISFTPWCI